MYLYRHSNWVWGEQAGLHRLDSKVSGSTSVICWLKGKAKFLSELNSAFLTLPYHVLANYWQNNPYAALKVGPLVREILHCYTGYPVRFNFREVTGTKDLLDQWVICQWVAGFSCRWTGDVGMLSRMKVHGKLLKTLLIKTPVQCRCSVVRLTAVHVPGPQRFNGIETINCSRKRIVFVILWSTTRDLLTICHKRCTRNNWESDLLLVYLLNSHFCFKLMDSTLNLPACHVEFFLCDLQTEMSQLSSFLNVCLAKTCKFQQPLTLCSTLGKQADRKFLVSQKYRWNNDPKPGISPKAISSQFFPVTLSVRVPVKSVRLLWRA